MSSDSDVSHKSGRGRFPLDIILRESVKSFMRNRGLETAATLAFFGFFSLIPMLLVVVFLASHFIVASEGALQALDQMTREFSPAFNTVVVKEVMLMSQRSGWSIISILLLFWAATPLAGSLRVAFRQSFGVTSLMPVWKGLLRDIFAVLLLMLLVLLVMVTRTVGANFGADWMPAWMSMGRMIRWSIALLCVVTFYVTFTPRLSTGLYVLGAALTTALLALVGALLGWVTRFNPNYGYAFGSLQTIFLVFVWVYYCFAAILLVAEILANLRNREMLALRGLFDPGRADARSRYFLHGILKKYPAGACIFTEGDSRHEMFYVVDGRVSLGASDQKARTVKAGDFFGEMAVLTRGRRTTTATAGDDGVTVAVITADHFETVLRENPRILKNLLNRMHDCAREIGDTVRI